uniref:Uncharacterized protein n=1 Tax=viral metagenome TaxID=1070528 RepID=A0A6M3Y073_9ZZZZ
MYSKEEQIRMDMVAEINSNPTGKEALIARYGEGNVFDTNELQKTFTVHSFAAPFCVVERKADGEKGVVKFQHQPRFYFDFTPTGG